MSKNRVTEEEVFPLSRKVDSLGRVLIPSEIRKELGIRSGDRVEVYRMKDKLYMRKPKGIKVTD